MPRSFYHILGLPDYANLTEVRRAFKQLAVRYHPDKNPGDKQAEEKFKEISNAYNVLGEYDTKQEYDIRLSGMNMLLKKDPVKEKEEKRKKMREELIRRRKREAEEKIINDWNGLNSGTPLWLRHSFNIGLMATGAIMIISNWFYTLESFSPLSLIFAIILILIGNVREQNLWYTRYLYQEFKGKISFKIPSRVMRNWVLGMTLSILTGIGGANLMKAYHFAYYSAVTTGIVEVKYKGTYTVNYTYWVNGKAYTKRMPSRNIYTLPSSRKVRVRYSMLNPVYAAVIEE